MTEARVPKKSKRMSRADLEFLNEQGWLNYEAERRYNEILRKRIEAYRESLARFEHSLERQQ